MSNAHKVASHEEWTAARTAFLAREKEFTRIRDELSQARRDLPWERVGKNYFFEGAKGRQTLAQLFDGRSQLIVLARRGHDERRLPLYRSHAQGAR